MYSGSGKKMGMQIIHKLMHPAENRILKNRKKAKYLLNRKDCAIWFYAFPETTQYRMYHRNFAIIYKYLIVCFSRFWIFLVAPNF